MLFVCAGMTSVGYAQQDPWLTDATKAFERARAQNKPLLIYFTGSDWCVWCKRLDAQILQTSEFRQAAQHWVLLKADFPRFSAQPDSIQRHNAALLKIYGVEGFPMLIFTDGKGNERGRMGYSNASASLFVSQLKSLAGNP